MRVKLFILSIPILCALPMYADAQIRMTEVMYNPDGSDTSHEWIELYNDSTSLVTLVAGSSGWKINDGSNHNLIDPASGEGRGSLTIPAKGFMIITNGPAEFIASYGGSYTVIKSAISLNNTAATLTLTDAGGTVIDTVAYAKELGAADDSNSLHRLNNTFVAKNPTPGVSEVTGGTTPAVTDESHTASSSTTAVASYGASNAPPPLSVRVTTDSRVMAGGGSYFTATAFGTESAPLLGARFVWNFGDGATAEGVRVFHSYAYPGRYSVSVSAGYNYAAGVARVVVEAVSTEVQLLAQGDGSLSIHNQSSKEINIGLWALVDGGATYTIPEDTRILPGEAVRFSSAITNLLGSPAAVVRYPNQSIVVSATVSTDSPLRGERLLANDVLLAITSPASTTPVVEEESVVPEVYPAAGEVLGDSTLPVSPIDTSTSHVLWWTYGALGTLLLFGAGGVYMVSIQRRKETSFLGDEFDIEA